MLTTDEKLLVNNIVEFISFRDGPKTFFVAVLVGLTIYFKYYTEIHAFVQSYNRHSSC